MKRADGINHGTKPIVPPYQLPESLKQAQWSAREFAGTWLPKDSKPPLEIGVSPLPSKHKKIHWA